MGCPQGSCSGPGFWSILYDPLLELGYPDGVEVIAFADDLLFLVEGDTEFEMECAANEALYMAEKWA